MSLPQSLIKRKPTITQKEFSAHWYNNHAPIVVPYFLSRAIQYYTQVCLPVSFLGYFHSMSLDSWSTLSLNLKTGLIPHNP